jgi:hypothetical protein
LLFGAASIASGIRFSAMTNAIKPPEKRRTGKNISGV